jgi:hypothetical protein
VDIFEFVYSQQPLDNGIGQNHQMVIHARAATVAIGRYELTEGLFLSHFLRPPYSDVRKQKRLKK